MAAAWLLLEILTVFFYTNLHEFTVTLSVDQTDESAPILINDSSTNTTYNSIPNAEQTNDEESGEGKPNETQEENGSSPNKNSSINSSNGYDRIRVIDNSESGPFIVRMYNEYIRDEMVAVLATTFTVFFMQTCLEVIF